MSSTSPNEFLHSIVIVFLWSAGIVLSANLVVGNVFSCDLSERTLWKILLLVFALLASFLVQLPGTDLIRASAAGSVEAEEVVKQSSMTSTPICNHQDKDLEILALRRANDKLEAAVARERKRTHNAESKIKAAEKKRDDLSYELQSTKKNWRQDYLTHVDVSVLFTLARGCESDVIRSASDNFRLPTMNSSMLRSGSARKQRRCSAARSSPLSGCGRAGSTRRRQSSAVLR